MAFWATGFWAPGFWQAGFWAGMGGPLTPITTIGGGGSLSPALMGGLEL